jgi:hypothetical protein
MTDVSDFLIESILAGDQADPLESARIPEPRAFRITARHRFARMEQRQRLREIVPEPPAPGESIHCTTGGKFELFTWIPEAIEWLGTADELYISTWTCSKPNAVELFELADAGRIGPIHLVTGLYFKRREGSIYRFLLDGLRKRGGTYRSFPNHSKVCLLSNAGKGDYLTVEGSGNLTANPQHENETIINSREVWQFHANWFREMLANIPPDKE